MLLRWDVLGIQPQRRSHELRGGHGHPGQLLGTGHHLPRQRRTGPGRDGTRGAGGRAPSDRHVPDQLRLGSPQHPRRLLEPGGRRVRLHVPGRRPLHPPAARLHRRYLLHHPLAQRREGGRSPRPGERQLPRAVRLQRGRRHGDDHRDRLRARERRRATGHPEGGRRTRRRPRPPRAAQRHRRRHVGHRQQRGAGQRRGQRGRRVHRDPLVCGERQRRSVAPDRPGLGGVPDRPPHRLGARRPELPLPDRGLHPQLHLDHPRRDRHRTAPARCGPPRSAQRRDTCA
jgi:hypothetical protein